MIFRDWCISRQLWWGHRLPLFETKYGWISAFDTNEAIKKIGAKMKLSEEEMTTLDIRQEEDVLDTWFSSALLPFSSFGWPDKVTLNNQFLKHFEYVLMLNCFRQKI